MIKNEGKLFDIIRFPIVTEKSNSMLEFNKYVFKVDTKSNKDSVKQAIEFIFDVKVDRVNILNTKSKKKKFKGIIGRTKSYKKAIVTLKDGYNIEHLVGA